MKVIITIPAYNEEKTLAKTILEIRAVMDKTSYDCF
jgi:glycosyltransferase involved in cell wall biosynthesis